jgi:hypothetical protein
MEKLNKSLKNNKINKILNKKKNKIKLYNKMISLKTEYTVVQNIKELCKLTKTNYFQNKKEKMMTG